MFGCTVLPVICTLLLKIDSCIIQPQCFIWLSSRMRYRTVTISFGTVLMIDPAPFAVHGDIDIFMRTDHAYPEDCTELRHRSSLFWVTLRGYYLYRRPNYVYIQYTFVYLYASVCVNYCWIKKTITERCSEKKKNCNKKHTKFSSDSADVKGPIVSEQRQRDRLNRRRRDWENEIHEKDDVF